MAPLACQITMRAAGHSTACMGLPPAHSLRSSFTPFTATSSRRCRTGHRMHALTPKEIGTSKNKDPCSKTLGAPAAPRHPCQTMKGSTGSRGPYASASTGSTGPHANASTRNDCGPQESTSSGGQLQIAPTLAHGSGTHTAKDGAAPPGMATRRALIGAVGAITVVNWACPCCSAAAAAHSTPVLNAGAAPLARVAWYDEFFATAMAYGMGSYETAAADIKRNLFHQLVTTAWQDPAGGTSRRDPQQTGPSSATEASDTVAQQQQGGQQQGGQQQGGQQQGGQQQRGQQQQGGQQQRGGQLRVLELGIGTGPNLGFLVGALQEVVGGSGQPPPVQVVGVDPNAAMQAFAKQSAEAAGLQPSQLELVQGDAGALPFPDASFDAAVCTLVLCSVPDPTRALSEVRRVLRPGGQLLFLEHVAAAWDTDPLIRAQQELWTPLQKALADGCHLQRETRVAVEGAGFSRVDCTSDMLQGVNSLLAPHIWGIAVK